MALLPMARMPLSIGFTILLAMYMASKAWVRARPTVPLTMPAAVEGTVVVIIVRIMELATRLSRRPQFIGALHTEVMIFVGGTP